MSKSKGLKQADVKNILNKYKAVLQKENFPVKSLILYGSYAQGLQSVDSDIDVCVVSEKFDKDKDYYENLLWKKVIEIDPRIEPVGYSPKSLNQNDPLASEIIKHGVEV